ncbi:Sideroflexin-1, putative [Pediculus humanus corporis]|uniref:Sidoreflexin n=1 Tax=Pediculus humanus subsp. corporis TaxID=121224 RepID=E0VHA9_PEDHC|nr:Sideroflexin-1, putative [Pediculus humanus corporis]EEB12765.1 Sideroflexin-1, putative [Pediculus humanus corporis]
MDSNRNIDITKPRYDQSTYWGRAKHFFSITNPLNLLNSTATLEESKRIVTAAKNKRWDELKNLSDADLWRAKEIYDSAYHPDTGELMNIIGRMSAQVPMNMAITGCMMNFYKSNSAVIFWQWVNQSFNALVNYTNRSGDAAISVEQIGKSYCLATGGALVTALSLNKMAARFPPLVGRIVPFVAVAAANCINIPMMRMQELVNGITITDENGNKLGESKNAATAAITAVTFSRIAMASPGMVITPIIMNKLEAKGLFKCYPWSSTPLSVLICGICLTFATPMCCALFEQRASIKVSDLEDDLKSKIGKSGTDVVYYNKGL